MPRLGLEPDVLSFNAVIDACARAGEVDRAEDYQKTGTTVESLSRCIDLRQLWNPWTWYRWCKQFKWICENMYEHITHTLISMSELSCSFLNATLMDRKKFFSFLVEEWLQKLFGGSGAEPRELQFNATCLCQDHAGSFPNENAFKILQSLENRLGLWNGWVWVIPQIPKTVIFMVIIMFKWI